MQARILIVEDNPFLSTVSEKILKKLGFSTEICDNGSSAIDMITGGNFNAILLDCELPILSGYDVAQEVRLREAEFGLPRNNIIACTANTMQGDRNRCLEAGMDCHVGKPLEEDELLTSFANLGIIQPTCLSAS